MPVWWWLFSRQSRREKRKNKNSNTLTEGMRKKKTSQDASGKRRTLVNRWVGGFLYLQRREAVEVPCF